MIDRLGKLILAFTVVVALCLFGGSCSFLKKDVEPVAKVCSEQVLPDALTILPAVFAYVSCEAAHANCDAAVQALKDAGTQDAINCGVALAHEATVRLAAVDAGAGQ